MPDDSGSPRETDACRVPDGAVLLADPAEVAAIFDRLAGEIADRLTGRRPLLLAILEGGRMPATEISRRLTIPHDTDTLKVGRYGDSETGGRLTWHRPPDSPLEGRTVVIVDDILDRGVTLGAVAEQCRRQGAAEVLTCVLTEKDIPGRLSCVTPDFRGIFVPDRFIVGCGMDYRGRWRELPGLYALEDSS
jgi:hypoxanthine phosphoribosyltransferase